MKHRVARFISRRRLSLAPRQVEIEQHDDAGLGVEARECDETDPDRDGHAVAQERKQPESPHQRERDRQHHQQRFDGTLGVEVEQQEDHEEREGHHQLEPLFRALQIAVLASPFEPISGRDCYFARDGFLGIADVVVDRPCCIRKDITRKLAVFVSQHRGPRPQPEIRDLAEPDLRAVHRRDANPAQ
ncbi:MAG TPA: hypothetical protein VH083_06550 [Myxococcales bacterium]|nr:hypothetical protein [Myxococcales bacterium]